MKVLVIGIDAMDPGLAFRLANEGKLPTIAGLMQKGSFGFLHTTIPSYSMVAWTSFMTGREPGGHGIFSNFRFKRGTYDHRLNNASDITVPYFWDFLEKNGKRCLIFSVLATYPVKPVNGLCIGGYSTPSEDVDFTYPKELKQEIMTKFNYRLHYTNIKELYVKGQHKEMLDMFYDRMNRKVTTFCHYLAKEQWDFAVCCITKGDTISHHYWRQMFLDSPHRTVMEEWYAVADGYIKRFIDAAGPDTSVMIISDHGFSKLDYNVNINNFLLEKEYLSVRKPRLAPQILGKLGLSKKRLRNLLIRFGFEKKLEKIAGGVKDLFPGATPRDIDFSQTRVFVKESAPEYGLVHINIVGMPQGIVRPEEVSPLVESLKRDFLALTHNCEKIVENVYLREEVYKGPYTKDAPHLLVKFKKGYLPSLFGDSLFTPANLATHADPGTFLAAGPLFTQKKNVEYAILDVAPTVLHMLGVPVPRSFDGKVMVDVLKAKAPPEYQEDLSIIDEIQL